MLVARRDPPFHADARDGASADLAPYPQAPRPHRLTRFTSAMQLVGSLVAVPVGLASAYSIYHATFSVEASCQSLRAGIVAMLDKSVDATTRRMLVRRDVVKFEQDCGRVDPDAVAAFKALLKADNKPVVAATPATPAAPIAQHSEAPAKEAVRKVEPRPPQAVKQAPAAKAAEAEPVPRETAISDTQWLDAVRQAIATHGDHEASDAVAKLRASEEAERSRAAVLPQRPLQETVVHPAAPAMAAPALTAPITLTPPPAVAAAPAPEADHPVPPAAIPDPVQAAAQKPDEPHSRIGKWIARVPLLGPVWENGQH